MGASRKSVLSVLLVVIAAVAACDVFPGGGQTLTDVRAERDGYQLTLSAPGWTFPGTTRTYLCPTDPGGDTEERLRETGCLDLGQSDASNGYQANVNLESLSSTQFLMFDASPQWFVVLTARSAGGAIESSATSPIPGGPIDQ